jgi:tyrosinase
MISDQNNLSRRRFLRDLSAGSVSLLGVSLLTGGCETILEQIEHRPVRRMIRNNPAANHQVDLYRTAVSLMKGLPTSDARNWTNQASIHNNHCPHGNWFFFPWHRAYLFFFEKICQKLTGASDFGLPYWNWCIDGHIPASYWNSPPGNALFDANRVATASSVADPSAVGLTVVDGLCNEPNFPLFAGGSASALRGGGGSYGNIEMTPHNYIHGTFVLGDMGNFMSPLDPIFWNHHCMVDLCWYEWNITRKHPNTNDTAWLDFSFTGMFFDADGNPAADMSPLATLLMPLLSYRYETGINGVAPLELAWVHHRRAFNRVEKLVKKGADVTLQIRKRFVLGRRVEVTLGKPLLAAFNVDGREFSQIANSQAGERAILTVRELAQPPSSDVFVRVFVNKADADAQTPTEDPHYTGSFYFFVHGDNAAGMNQADMHHDWLVDLTPALKRLGTTAGGAPGQVTISLVAVPAAPGRAQDLTISAADLELVISPLTVRLMEF